jgi:hypothetical protein
MITERDIQQERLFYLEFLALFTGQVTRKDLVSRFGISEPAATKDLSLYAEKVPGALNYDLRQKCYVLAEEKPLFNHEIDQALYALAGERAIAINPEHAKRLDSWVNSSIKRRMLMPTVAGITRCMFQGRKMMAEYVSLTSGGRERELTPLALVHDGLRWHIRCFYHERNEHRDYNLARFKSVRQADLSDASLKDDTGWNTEVTLKLVPHPRAEHPETIRLDYDMVDGMKAVPIRACLVGYFLRHWHIDYSDEATDNPKARHLYLSNKSELLRPEVPAWAFNPG